MTNVPLKDQLQTIDDRAHSLSIIITNYKNTWTKKKFLDFVATLQGNVLHWLKQWEESNKGKLEKAAVLANFNSHDKILS